MRRKSHTNHATVKDFLAVVAAVHLSSYVESPFKDRGGLMLVGAPGTLKTTMADFLDQNFSDAITLSDVNTQSLTKLKDRISNKQIRTLVLSEMQKLYERHISVAAGIEGTLRALAGEGFQAASFEDATIARMKARVTIVGCMTPSLREKNATRWDESGFHRRFLWCLITLRDPGQLERAVVEGRLIDIAGLDSVPRIPAGGIIPDTSTKQERAELLAMCKYQPTPHNVQGALLVKTWCVLKWWSMQQRRSEKTAWAILKRFGLSLGRDGVELVV